MNNNTPSLHQFKTRHCRYALVMLLVFCFGLIKLSTWHEPDHFVQKDTHCSYCVSSVSFDHSLASTELVVDKTDVAYEIVNLVVRRYFSADKAVTGNRDPPVIS